MTQNWGEWALYTAFLVILLLPLVTWAVVIAQHITDHGACP